MPNQLTLRIETVEFLGDSWRYHLVAGAGRRGYGRLGRRGDAGIRVRRPGESALGFWLVMAPALLLSLVCFGVPALFMEVAH